MTDQLLTIATEGSRAMTGYLARPGRARAPGVVVLSDMFGLNEPIRAIADRYAGRGHPALVPNLFWRSEIPGAISYDEPQHPEAWARLKALDLDVVDRRHAAARRIGCARSRSATARSWPIGFCGGGRFAYLAAVRCRRRCARPRSMASASRSISARSANARVPAATALRAEGSAHPAAGDRRGRGRRARTADVEVFLYPEAGHSFANPVRPTYDPAAAALAVRADRPHAREPLTAAALLARARRR